MSARIEPPDDLPAPTAVLVLWRVAMEAHLAMLPRKKGERLLRAMAVKLAEEQSLAGVFHIRPRSELDEVQRARRQAAELFGRYMPALLARLPED